MNVSALGFVDRRKRHRLVELEIQWYVYLEQALGFFRLRSGAAAEQQRWLARGYAEQDVRNIMKLTHLIHKFEQRHQLQLADEMKRVLKQHLWLLHKYERVGNNARAVLH
jgi:hypothetical protein